MSDEKGFWSSLPGVLTALATLVTALTGLYLAVFSSSEETSPEKNVAVSVTTVAAKTEARAEPKVTAKAASNTAAPSRINKGEMTSSQAHKKLDVVSIEGLSCDKFSSKNSVASLMSWSNYYHKQLVAKQTFDVVNACQKSIEYRAMAYCQDIQDLEVKAALKSSLELCQSHGYDWSKFKY